jgi:hypothetical protein
MPIFRIERTREGWTESDHDAAKLRSEICALHLGALRWIHSYVDADLAHTICIYEADSEQHVRDYAAEAKLPIDSVREVFEVGPEATAAEADPEAVELR